jgi:TolB-like protein
METAGLFSLRYAAFAIFRFYLLVPNTQPLGPAVPQTQDSDSSRPAQRCVADKASIVVLPFVNMSKNPTRVFQRWPHGSLTGDLSRYRASLLSPATLPYLQRQGSKVQDVGREMGVRYVLEGRAS